MSKDKALKACLMEERLKREPLPDMAEEKGMLKLCPHRLCTVPTNEATTGDCQDGCAEHLTCEIQTLKKQAENEKQIRIKYQNTVYEICQLFDKNIPHKKGGGHTEHCTIDEVAEKVRESLTGKGATTELRDKVRRIIRDIDAQSTRRNRACDNKEYLITDLQVIESKCLEALAVLAPEGEEVGK